jgi:hypothetical protein
MTINHSHHQPVSSSLPETSNRVVIGSVPPTSSSMVEKRGTTNSRRTVTPTLATTAIRAG